MPIPLILVGLAALGLILAASSESPAPATATGEDTPPAPENDPQGDDPAPDDPTPPPAPDPARTAFLSRFADSEFNALVSETESVNDLPPFVLAALLYKESRFNPKAHNNASGAQGIAQILPTTAAQPGHGVEPITDAYDPNEAIPFAGAYLAALTRESGSIETGLAAYNWGLRNVQSGKDYPAETRDYVDTITTLAGIA